MIGRQQLVGWLLIVVAVADIVSVLKLRLFEPGPPLERKEWVQFIGTIVVFMIGTANVRLAAMREGRHQGE